MTVNLTDGFDHYYRASSERIEAAFRSGLIVLDTNVLLNVLRYSPSARDELLGVIEGIADRCLVPHQVAVEYNRNRVAVVVGRQKELTEAASEIDAIRVAARTLVNRLRDRRMLPAAEVRQLDDSVTQFLGALATAASEAADQYDLDPARLVGQVDIWTERLVQALEGRVAERPADDVLTHDQEEASRRRKMNIAPGFKDEAGGDYMWWAEVMRSPDLRGRPLVVVSDDTGKGDWLFREHGITVGPHAVLIEDARDAGATDLVLLPTSELLRLAETVGISQVSDSTIDESEKALTPADVPWTLAGYVELIHALEAEGYGMRVEVIRAAARNGGSLTRKAVYRIAGISEEDRSLRQFVTPVWRVTGYLQEAEVVPHGVSKALDADYHDGPGKASGYSVPEEFTEFEQVVLDAEEIVHKSATTDWSLKDQVQAQMRSSIKRRAQTVVSPDAASRVAELLLSRAESRQRASDLTAETEDQGTPPTSPEIADA